MQIGKVLVEVKEYFNPHLNLSGFLFTMSDPTVNSRTSLKLLRQTYPDQVFRTIIPRNTDLGMRTSISRTYLHSMPLQSPPHGLWALIGEIFDDEATQ